MVEDFPRGNTAIVAAETYGIGEAPGMSSIELAASASLKALNSIGLTPKDVDGLFIGTPEDHLSGLTMTQYLGLSPKLTDNNRTGGTQALTHAIHAAYALVTGQCDVALITYGSNQRTATGSLVTALRPPALEAPFNLLRPIGAYALAASRYQYMYGLKREQLGAVAIAARQWAALNPDAFMRDPLDMAGYMSARMVSDPLGVRDCCLVTDGAAAVVMVRADRAKDLVRRSAYILGGAAATQHFHITAMPDLTRTAAALSGQRAFAQAGMKPSDVDVVQLYDAFTINVILFLEDLGFCGRGEAASFMENGAIAPGGVLPVNTNGGGLSCVHPGMYGLFGIVEACQQIMERGGARQIPNAKVALAHANGGELSSQATLLLGSADVL